MTEVFRLGLLRLSDAAPVILAQETGIFASQGLDVALSIEPSWANIADKLGYGLLDGAVLPPPLAMACALGLRGLRTDMIIPMSVSANGNSVALAQTWREAFHAGLQNLKPQFTGRRLRFAVVHAYSTHDLLLRYWLAAAGLNPDEDIDITVLPPFEMPAQMAAGKIDGFCAGAPWGLVAAQMGAGFTAIETGQIWRDHPEKCLAIRTDFFAHSPAIVTALLRAMLDAAARCADSHGIHALAKLMARPEYLDLPESLVQRSLAAAEGGPKFDQNFPSVAQGKWLAGQMLRWNKITEADMAWVEHLYRPDLFSLAGGSIPEPRREIFCDSLD